EGRRELGSSLASSPLQSRWQRRRRLRDKEGRRELGSSLPSSPLQSRRRLGDKCGTRAAARQRRLSGDDDDSDKGGALATLTTTATTEGLVDNDGARWTATSGSGTTSSIHRATSISAPSHLFTLPRLAPLAREGRWRADLPPPVVGSDGGA
ncbi:hypothetical protein EE612_043271, partial [Oryza sativa]